MEEQDEGGGGGADSISVRISRVKCQLEDNIKTAVSNAIDEAFDSLYK